LAHFVTVEMIAPCDSFVPTMSVPGLSRVQPLTAKTIDSPYSQNPTLAKIIHERGW